MKTGSAAAVVAASLLALAGCAGNAPPAAQGPAQLAAVSLPAADTAGAQGLLSPDETLEVVDFAGAGSTTVSGSVQGYQSTAYAVPVAGGQRLTVTFTPSNPNLYINIHDTADQSGAAVHRGEIDGPSAVLTPVADVTYLIRPFQPRATARRNESGTYTITIARN